MVPMSLAKRASSLPPGSSSPAGRPSSAMSSALVRAVVNRQAIARRDDERTRRQRMRRDERDDEAFHPPRHHRSAVGEVVAGGAGRRGDDQAIAAHVADELAFDLVGDLGDALSDLAVDGDVVDRGAGVRRARVRLRRPPAAVDAPPEPSAGRSRIAGRRSSSKSPSSARRMPASISPGSTVARKPISPKLIGEHRNLGARVEPQRLEDRAVAAEHHAQLDVILQRGVEAKSGAALQTVLAGLLGVQAQRHARRGRLLGQPTAAPGRVVGAAVREHRELPHGSTSRARRWRPASLDARAAAPGAIAPERAGVAVARSARVGEPDERLAVALRSRPAPRSSSRAPPHRAPARPRLRPRAPSGERPASRTTPPLPTRPRPTSNCGLTSASAS